MDLREQLVNAAIDAIRLEVGAECVVQRGTRVQTEDTFKMARVIEAAFLVLYNDLPEELVEEVGQIIASNIDSEVDCRDLAADITLSIFRYVIERLDPLP